MDVEDDDPVPKARGVKRRSEAIIMTSDEEDEAPPRKRIVKNVRVLKTAPQTKRVPALDLGDESEEESSSTKKKPESSSKNGPAKAKPRTSKVVDSEPGITDDEPKKAVKPAKKKGALPKKMSNEDKKAEDKQKPE
jgi:hypothetical protein